MSETRLTAVEMRRLILAEAPASISARKLLDHLSAEAPQRFATLCHALLHDNDPAVLWVPLSQLGQHGHPGDKRAETLILSKVDLADISPDGLADVAFFALGSIGTERAFPILAHYAAVDRSEAFIPAAKQARMEQQKQTILDVAREVFRDIRQDRYRESDLRESALVVLQMLSTIAREEELLLYWLEKEPYPDVFVIKALGQASERALPLLQRLSAEASGTDVGQAADFAIHDIRHPPTPEERLRRPMHPALKRYLRERAVQRRRTTDGAELS